ncbi:MAG: choice-of-anchor D domain-containing protein [Bacteroidetes bacterium]|nr:choice-of-anchor D domain-containing protein [Bacteroidota bacterium]MCW5897115.1 choice-of-anchor D domain-containing protein [Bacteroidota bacterium]
MKRTFKFFISLVILVACSEGTNAQTVKQRLWVTDGEVRAIVKSGRISYVGGSFGYVGPVTGGAVVLSSASGLILPSSPKVNGDVLTVAADGNNGWYIGGSFTEVNGVARSRAAKILPNGSLDNTWNPQFDGPVHAIVVGTAGVYVGGSFSRVGAAVRNNAALLNPTNAAVLSWNPNPNNTVRTIQVVPPYVYVGGEFTAVGVVPIARDYVARIDISSGGVDSVWSPSPNGFVLSILTAVGQNNVWLGGEFSLIDTSSRPHLASVTSGGTGFVTDWNPRPNGPVHVLRLAGSRLHVGGRFTAILDSVRGNAAAVDPFVSRLLSWNPNLNGPVNTMEFSGGIFYVGGLFSSVGVAQRRNIAAVDSVLGNVSGWNPVAGSEVKVIGVQSNVFLGGLFRSVNGAVRRNVAALDDTAGATAFNPNVNGGVNAMRLSGNTLYLGGGFDTVSGQRITRLAAVNANSGFPTAWRPQVGPDGVVNAIELSGPTVYAGGTFTTVGTTQRRYLVALDSATGSLTAWNPNPDDHVLALKLSGGVLYASGLFTQIGTEPRNRVAAINLATGAPTVWEPNTAGVTSISALAVTGPAVYVGGAFTTIGGQQRNALAALDLTRGDITEFNAGLASQSSVNVIVPAGNSLYVGGILNSTSDLISVNRVSGAINPWNPQVVGGVSAIAISVNDTSVLAGGRFTHALSDLRPSLAAFTDPAVLLPAFVMNRTSIPFGTVPLGGEKSEAVVITNTGGASLVLSDIATSNPAFAVLLLPFPPIEILPGQSRVYSISFLPSTGGPQTGVITFTHTAAGSPATLPVSGTGFGPFLVASKLDMPFGSIRVGTTREDTITLANTGNDTLKISLAAVTDTQFIVSPSLANILPSANRVFTVTFRPGYREAFGGLLRFEHNAAGSPTSIGISGTGVASELVPLPRIVQFDSVAVGSSRTRLLSIVNGGDANLNVSNVRIIGPNANEFAIVGTTGPFPPVGSIGDTLRIPIRFSPVSLQENKSASLVIHSDALVAVDTVLLRGSGRTTLIQVTIGGDTLLGSQINVTAQGPPGFQILRAALYYRAAGRFNYDSLDLTVSGQAYTGFFPDSAVTPRGIEYFVRLTGTEESITNPELNPEENPAIVRVKVGALVTSLQFEPRKYRMISVPLDLADADPEEQLVDDYGPYNQTRWRLFRWEGDRNVELPAIQHDFRPGYAFWLITSDGKRFDAKDGKSVLSGIPFNIQLVPGWNQIAAPFAFSVDWEEIENHNLVQRPVFWNGDEFDPDVELLHPWEGYFVLNDSSQPITLSVPSFESTVRRPKNAQPFPLKNDGDYVLQLSAFSGTMKDSYNYLGFVGNATPEFDRLDIVEPPPIDEYVNLAIVENGRKYLGNFKPQSERGNQWRVQIASTQSDQTVAVAVREIGRPVDGFNTYILDEDEFAYVPLANGSFSVRSGAANTVRSFRVIIGTPEFAREASGGIPLAPVEYVLDQNYPNPFNPITTIRFALSKRSEVSLSLYNLLGQKVRTLVSGEQTTGIYSVVWDGLTDGGSQAASGVYVYRLRAGEFQATRKLLLLR